MVTNAELIEQAYKLYYVMRVRMNGIQERSDRKKRLFFIGRKAFYRYKRRLEAEKKHVPMFTERTAHSVSYPGIQ